MNTFGPTCDIFWTNFRSTSIASPTHGEEAYVPHTAGHMKNMKHPSNTWIFSMFFFPANLFERSQFDSLRPIHVSGNRWWWRSRCRILRLITKKLLEILFGPEWRSASAQNWKVGPPSKKKATTHANMFFFLWSGRVSFFFGISILKKIHGKVNTCTHRPHNFPTFGSVLVTQLLTTLARFDLPRSLPSC